MKAIVLHSGGINSTAVLFSTVKRLGKENVRSVYFRFGTVRDSAEYECVRKIGTHLGIHYEAIDITSLCGLSFKLGIFLSTACGMADHIGAEELVTGIHDANMEPAPDHRDDFIEAISASIRLGTYSKIELRAPYQDFRRYHIIELGNVLRVPWENTYQCKTGDPNHCGQCEYCAKRKVAFSLAGAQDPIKFKKG